MKSITNTKIRTKIKNKMRRLFKKMFLIKPIISVVTFGCSYNHSDSNYMKSLLVKEGYKLTDNTKKADLIIINSCAVKNTAETKLYREIRKAINRGQKVVVGGCVTQAKKRLEKYMGQDYNNKVSIIGVEDLFHIVNVVDNEWKNNHVKYLSKTNKQRRELQQFEDRLFNDAEPILSEQKIGILPINRGCSGNCSYCITKFSRGAVYSFRPRLLREQMKKMLEKGAKEIWITSQDTASYGRDIKTNLVELLNSLLEIKGDYKLRIGMGNPEGFLKIKKQLVNLFNSKKGKKIYKFLHIPSQSGSDKVLKDMKRAYTREQYIDLINFFRVNIPNLTISNDIIVAFPTETEKDFKQTIDLIKETNPEILNISRFWPRPGTIAYEMQPVFANRNNKSEIGKISKKRVSKLKKLHDELFLNKHKKLIGKTLKVFVNEKGKNNTMKARTENYLQVIVKDIDEKYFNKWIDVKITEVKLYDLIGFNIRTN